MAELNAKDVVLGHKLDALAHVEAVGKKIFDGTYAKEVTKCPCGADNDLLLTEYDRYHLPHPMVICQECALMRANPRLTADSYEAYYNNEYRHIHIPRLPGASHAGDMDNMYALEAERGKQLQKLMDDFAIDPPKVVVDFGCYVGGSLQPFKEQGAETWGVEIDVNARIYAGDKGHNMVASLDELIEEGVKADLVVMHDIIEHLTDLTELQKLQHVLKPGAHLYVWTPGYFRSDLTWYFQLAHTYQFCAQTLEWHMMKLGFQEVYVDEDIKSFWQWIGPDHGMDIPKPTEWVEYITDHWFRPNEKRKMPRFRGVCKFPQKLLYENIAANLAEKAPDLEALTRQYQGDLIVVAGGPSIEGQIDTLKQLKADGAHVIAIARMLPWCVKNGITPDFVVSLDCSEEQEKCFQGFELPKETKYLLASVTRPAIFEILRGQDRYVFDTRETLKLHKLRFENGYRKCTVINGGSTVAITCLTVGMNLGFSRFHCFGMDFLVQDKAKSHAEGIAGASVAQNFIEVEVAGENITTTASFIDFANQVLDMASLAHDEGMLESIKFYGDSLVSRMWDGVWYEEAEVAA